MGKSRNLSKNTRSEGWIWSFVEYVFGRSAESCLVISRWFRKHFIALEIKSLKYGFMWIYFINTRWIFYLLPRHRDQCFCFIAKVGCPDFYFLSYSFPILRKSGIDISKWWCGNSIILRKYLLPSHWSWNLWYTSKNLQNKAFFSDSIISDSISKVTAPNFQNTKDPEDQTLMVPNVWAYNFPNNTMKIVIKINFKVFYFSNRWILKIVCPNLVENRGPSL